MSKMTAQLKVPPTIQVYKDYSVQLLEVLVSLHYSTIDRQNEWKASIKPETAECTLNALKQSPTLFPLRGFLTYHVVNYDVKSFATSVWTTFSTINSSVRNQSSK